MVERKLPKLFAEMRFKPVGRPDVEIPLRWNCAVHQPIDHRRAQGRID